MEKRDLLFEQLTKKAHKKRKRETQLKQLIAAQPLDVPRICKDIVDSIPTLEGAILAQFDDPTRVSVDITIRKHICNNDDHEYALNPCERALVSHLSWKSFVVWLSDLLRVVKDYLREHPSLAASVFLETIQYAATIDIEFNRFRSAWNEAHPQFECRLRKDIFAVAHDGDVTSLLCSHLPIIDITAKKHK